MHKINHSYPLSVNKSEDEQNKILLRRITLHIMPFILLAYVVSYLDRVNISFAKLRMASDLHLSETTYGLGAGIFFLGYVIFEVPSNLLLTRIGVRSTISRIMVLWGCASTCMIFVKNEYSFYAVRFALGVFEAGFAPAMLYYLTCWFPHRRRAEIMAIFLLAGPIGNSIGGPMSTWVMEHLDQFFGLSGWQWMFLIEGLPSIVLGLFALRILDERAADARWLSLEEKVRHTEIMFKNHSAVTHSISVAVKSPFLYLYGVVYFCIISGIYAVSFWLPTIIQHLGVKSLQGIGWLSALPNVLAIGAMMMNARRSDAHDERRWHLAMPMMAGSLGLVILGLSNNVVMGVIALALTTMAVNAALAVFWAAPTAHFEGAAAAGSVAIINSLGAIGGFVGPTIMGWMHDLVGSFSGGLYIISGLLLCGSVLCLRLISPRQERGSEFLRS